MNFENLTNTQKGSVFMAIGAILLLYTFGVFASALRILILLSGIFLIIYGFILGDFLPKIKALVKK